MENATASGECGEILKPRTDKREYRRIVLKNSLEVLLISDPETDKVKLDCCFNFAVKEELKIYICFTCY